MEINSLTHCPALAVTVALALFAVSAEAQQRAIDAPIPGTDGVLEGADYWSETPKILSAGLGFEGIIGLDELTEESLRAAGAGWFGSMTCTNGDVPPILAKTAATDKATMAALATGTPDFSDALPIVFSWPVATETIDVSDFHFTLNTGDIGTLTGFTMFPNWELNERNVVVVMGELGNRGRGDEADAIFPVRLDVVGDLTLVGPGGQEFNARGLSWETEKTPYDSGPVLVGAKITHVDPVPIGEGGLRGLELLTGAFPNDELALHGAGDFRIRVLTSGGFSPDGVSALRPDHFQDFFRLHATGIDGETVLLDTIGVDYAVAGGSLRIIGMADLGQRASDAAGIFYDDCYAEDRDNYIDIILVGDEAAARNVTFVEIPALEGGYRAFFNPGGPGPDPFEGVRYTAPGPSDLEPVINALDDPMRVSRAGPPEPTIISLRQGDVILAQNAGMLPESIAWDAAKGHFLTSSIAFGGVFSVQDTGVTRPFIQSSNLTSTVGLTIDAARGRLLVTNGDFMAAVDEDRPGFAQLGIYDLATGEELHFVDLGALAPGLHMPNDVTLDADGNAYVTDSLAPVIYKVDVTGSAELFAIDTCFGFLNGIVYHPNGYLLVSANDDRALLKVPLDDPSRVSEVDILRPVNADGMILTDSLDLLAVIRPPVGSLLRLQSDDDWASASVAERAPAILRSFPTDVTLRDGSAFVIHANFGAIRQQEVPLAFEILRPNFEAER